MNNSLAQKLQIKPGKSLLFYNAPDNYLEVLEGLPEGTIVKFIPEGKFDGVLLFVKNSADLILSLKIIVPVLKPDTVFWISYPKKSSGIANDLEMMGNWDELAKYGLRVVSAASINQTWTALRLSRISDANLSDTRNEAIRKNEYAEFIDVDNKQISLPAEIQTALNCACFHGVL